MEIKEPKEPLDEMLYSVNYNCNSVLGESSPDRFLKFHFGEIYEIDHETTQETLIGKINLKILLISAALNAGLDLEEVFDADEDTYQIGKKIYHFDSQRIKEDIDEFYISIHVSKICIIDTIELQEKYRGSGVSLKIIKDLYTRFDGDSTLIVAHMLPVQFENRENKAPEWEKFIAINQLEEDFEKSYYKLKALFQGLGFDHIEGYDNLMFLNPEDTNEILRE